MAFVTPRKDALLTNDASGRLTVRDVWPRGTFVLEGSMPGGHLDECLPFKSLGIAVLTVSDTRDEESDTSGALLADRVVAAGHRVAARALVKDDKRAIQGQARALIPRLTER